MLADGFHRVRAYQQVGRSEIEADVYQGDRDDALWFALGANRAHGQRLSSKDKRRAIQIAYNAWPDVSQVRIATQVGCTHQYVGKVRQQLATSCMLPDRVVGSDGRERPATRPSASRQRARAEDDAAPATQNQRPVDGSDSPERTVGTDGKTYPADRNRPDNRPEEGIEPATETPEEEGQAEDAATPKSPSARRNENDKPSRGARERSNRIVAIVASDAQNLTAQEELIDFRVLDREKLPEWIADLKNAQQNLGRLIRRLQKEMTDGSDPNWSAIRRAQRAVARCHRGSGRRRKRVAQLARVRRRAAVQRRNSCHRITTRLVARFDTIAVEDLRVSNLTRSAKGTAEAPGRNVRAKAGLNRSILEQSWGLIHDQLVYKAAWAGRQLIEVNPKFTSQDCSACGGRRSMPGRPRTLALRALQRRTRPRHQRRGQHPQGRQ